MKVICTFEFPFDMEGRKNEIPKVTDKIRDITMDTVDDTLSNFGIKGELNGNFIAVPDNYYAEVRPKKVWNSRKNKFE